MITSKGETKFDIKVSEIALPGCYSSAEQNALGMCQNSSVFNRSALDYPCEQCMWHPRNIKRDVWYE